MQIVIGTMSNPSHTTFLYIAKCYWRSVDINVNSSRLGGCDSEATAESWNCF